MFFAAEAFWEGLKPPEIIRISTNHNLQESLTSLCKRARPRSGLIDLLLGRLGIELRRLDAAVIEVALDLVDRNAFAQHLRRPPMAEIMGMDMG